MYVQRAKHDLVKMLSHPLGIGIDIACTCTCI